MGNLRSNFNGSHYYPDGLVLMALPYLQRFLVILISMVENQS